MRPYEALRAAVALLKELQNAGAEPEFSIALGLQAKLAEKLPALEEAAEGKLPRLLVKDGVLTCPHCGGTEFQEHEDILAYRDVEGIHKGIIYTDSYDSRSDGGENQRVVCQNDACSAWLDYPEGVEIEYDNMPDEDVLCECGRDWEACATRDGAEEHRDRT
jgi:hypothetical protein